MSKFSVGEDLYVRDPERFVPNCRCIVGPVISVSDGAGERKFRLAASIGRLPKFGGGYDAEMEFSEADLGHRIGTPISQLSGRPGHRGYERFVEIARSWGYD